MALRPGAHISGRRPIELGMVDAAAKQPSIVLSRPQHPSAHHPSCHSGARPVASVPSAQLHTRAACVPPLQAALDEAMTASSMPVHTEAPLQEALPLPDPLPVMVCRTHQLQAQVDLHAATAALREAVGRLVHSYQGLRSGCVRVEVPIPCTSSALHWLAGQMHASRRAQTSKAIQWPCVYFSCRYSSAPDTPSTAKAEACSKGLAALAGIGSAWHWHGQAAGGFGSVVVQQMQRFLSGDQPHIRILGGTRFDTDTVPAEEWAALGAYLFSLPLLEYSERGSGAVLACTLAWDTALSSSGVTDMAGTMAGATPVWGSGAASLDTAVDHVMAALQHMQPPAEPSSGAQHVQHVSWDHVPSEEQWHQSMAELLQALKHDEQPGGSGAPVAAAHRSSRAGSLDLDLARGEYLTRGQQGLDDLLAAVGGAEARPSRVPGTGQEGEPGTAGGDLRDPDQGSGSRLTKVVMARRTQLEWTGRLDPLWVLEALQERDPRAYQLFISDGQGTSFVACTPERLYVRTGRDVASEAVAATRARGPPGDIERDFWLSMELLNSAKDHHEFVLVRDWIRDALATCSVRVDVEVPKSVLKQGSMQHLYGRLAARLRPGVDDSQILRALHPTPAVCGRPRDDAKEWLTAQEQFDRGFYAGPFGWVSGEGAEFAVAIRSALFRSQQASDTTTTTTTTNNNNNTAGATPLQQTLALPTISAQQQQQQGVQQGVQRSVYLYSGVGVVQGSCASSEWQELDLKTRPFRVLLQPGVSLSSFPNVNVAWAYLLVEECCRQGINMFCIAPGSRSSPLTAAVASHPRARLNICIDERSLGFWALGYGRATGRPAVVITSSGTAVANLLPACVEASQSEVPLLLVTADRPAELRDTGANQTIDQVKIFGGYTRWFQDVAAPTSQVPGRALLTTVSTACRFTTGAAGAPGPVHLNMQFREPLAPITNTWEHSPFMQGLDTWLANPCTPYTTNITTSNTTISLQGSAALDAACQQLWRAQRGLLVVGELTNPADATAVLALARHLRWPVAVDILSGLRTAQLSALQHEGVCLVSYMDHLLLGDKAWWQVMAPDVVLQVGPRVTSKRLNQFMEWAESAGGSWMYVGSSSCRHDAAHLVTHHLTVPVMSLARHLDTAAAQAQHRHVPPASLENYRSLLQGLNQVAHEEIESVIGGLPTLSEPAVARQLAGLLPPGHALFLGNSMPIRDMDMYAQPRTGEGLISGLNTAANRGASGIDGVLSTAAGFAEGKSRPTTLVIGDLSFLHDSNGLNMLRAGEARPPLTVVLINNNGGGIFSFLPIHGALPKEQFEPLWATPQNADFEGLCRSHGLPYQRVNAGADLQQALKAAWSLNRHSVVEVVTERDSNVRVHRAIQQRVQRAVQTWHAWAGCHYTSSGGSSHGFTSQLSISGLSWRRFELPLLRPLTTTGGTAQQQQQVRQGYTLEVTATSSDGRVVVGRGEVAPLPGLHQEDLAACNAQLRLIARQLPQQALPLSLGLLGGRLRGWINQACLHPADDLLPSVRFGLEMAVLDCLSQCRHQDSCLLPGYMRDDQAVQVAGLVAVETAQEAAQLAVKLVEQEGYKALKIKVARRGMTPEADVQRVLAVRAAVGPTVTLRADANKGWSLAQARQFGGAVASAGLEFVEEPTADVKDAPTFSELTGIPFALDESLDITPTIPATSTTATSPRALIQELHRSGAGGLAAVVLKPAALGGYEDTLAVATYATGLGLKVIISSSFDGPLGLAHCVELANAVDVMQSAARQQQANAVDVMQSAARQQPAGVSHGLGTLAWYDPTRLPPGSTRLGASTVTRSAGPIDSATLVPGVALSQDTPQVDHSNMSTAAGTLQGVAPPSSQQQEGVTSPSPQQEGLTASSQRQQQEGLTWTQWTFSHQRPGRPAATIHATTLQHSGTAPTTATLLFLHGFMGCKEDWQPIMEALVTPGTQCVSVDLPGHAASSAAADYSTDDMADLVGELIRSRLPSCTLIGYSMGARVALCTAVRHGHVLDNLVCISGTPGIKDAKQAQRRAAADRALADMLRDRGLTYFINHWYNQSLWASLRRSPTFQVMRQRRLLAQHTETGLAGSLTHASTGRMESMWSALPALTCRLLIVTGEQDEKFAVISNHMCKVAGGSVDITATCVSGAGHAVHVERPWPVVQAIRSFLKQQEQQ